jgi:hypothetical protein
VKDSLGNTIPKSAQIIRATEVVQFRQCRRQWYFSSHNGLNLEPIVESHALRFGKAWHKALEYLYEPGRLGDPLDAALQGLEEQYNQEREKVGLVLEDFGDVYQAMQEELQLGKQLLEHYIRWAENEAKPSDRALKPRGVEVRLLIPLPTDTGTRSRSWLAVRLDGIVETQDGLIWVLEHKTRHKGSSVDDPDCLPLDIQMGLQIWALKQQMGKEGAKVAGALYNLVRKQLPSPRVRSPIFGRHMVFRSTQELNHLIKQIYYDSLEMRKTARDPERYCYHNPQPWGFLCAKCPFCPPCEAIGRGEDVAALLYGNYRKREKDVFQMLEEEMSNGID